MRIGTGSIVGILALGLVACNRGPSPEVQAQLDQMVVVSAEKDSLLAQVAENARLMSEISAQLVAVADREKLASSLAATESPMAASRDSLRIMVGDVTQRIQLGEDRLRESQRRIRGLSRVSDSLKNQFETTVASLSETLENQKTTIATLTARVEQLEAENVVLATEKAALADTVEQLVEEPNTAYYVIGTKDELIERGIVTEEGGSRVLFIFGKAGKTIVPARELDPTDFTPIDIRAVTEITLPDSTEEYRIASRQNLGALAQPLENGKIRNTNALRIVAPDQFWMPSKFLILVRS
jgi:cell division protein FtsB